MTRLHLTIALLIGVLLPLDAAAFWLPESGLCLEDQGGTSFWEMSGSEPAEEADCDGPLDPTDPSFNACFELADGPISTLPELMAQEQAQQVVTALFDKTNELLVPEPTLPSPGEASLNPEPAEPPIVVNVPRPRPRPNSCSVYPDNCETAPTIPTLNLEGSSAQANRDLVSLNVPPPILPEMRRGPPNEGVAAATGFASRLDRPPQAG